jgi:dihydrofolate reductase
MNSIPKYVLSSTLEDLEWNNSTILNGDAVNEVSKLRERLKGEIVVPASLHLVHTLIENDLVDELRLMIFPFVLGSGKRLFHETSDKLPLRLVTNRTVGDGLPYVIYEIVRAA